MMELTPEDRQCKQKYDYSLCMQIVKPDFEFILHLQSIRNYQIEQIITISKQLGYVMRME